MPSEMKRLRQLEEENGKLKKIVADLSLDKAMHPLERGRPRAHSQIRGGIGCTPRPTSSWLLALRPLGRSCRRADWFGDLHEHDRHSARRRFGR
jgi:hypothetical protein